MLKTLNKKFTDLASAVAFAECGEWDYAREFLGDFESAAKSTNRKFVVMFEDKIIEQSFLDYATNLSKRLCYDIIFLHTPRRGEGKKRVKSSFKKIKNFFFEHYQEFVAAVNAAGISVHYFVSAGTAGESLEKLYHKVGHVEFAIIQDGIGLEECNNLGLPLFVFRH